MLASLAAVDVVGGRGRDNLVRGSLRALGPTVIPWRARRFSKRQAVVTRGKVSALFGGLKGRANPKRKLALQQERPQRKSARGRQHSRRKCLGETGIVG